MNVMDFEEWWERQELTRSDWRYRRCWDAAIKYSEAKLRSHNFARLKCPSCDADITITATSVIV